MTLRKARLIALVLLVVGAASPALATTSSWRCGSRLVGAGSTIEDVYERCGEPSYRTASTEIVSVQVAPAVTVMTVVPIEHWTYNSGRKRFMRALTFRDGTLVDIDEGSYGY